MAEVLRLRVYTRGRQLVDQDGREVTAPGVYGEIGVLPDHAALVTTLEPGVLSYKDTAGAVASVQVTGGVAEGPDNGVSHPAHAGAAAAGRPRGGQRAGPGSSAGKLPPAPAAGRGTGAA